MIKKLLLLLVCSSVFYVSAKDVDSVTAAAVAKNFYIQTVLGGANSNVSLTLVYQSKIEPANAVGQATGAHLYYVFNVDGNNGFVIVSGDDVVSPVPGYSDKGSYDSNNLSPEFKKWVEGYNNQIIWAKENNMSATYTIGKQWSNLVGGRPMNTTTTRGSVAPLLKTTWDQGNIAGYYNAMCPIDKSLPDKINKTTRCVTGCVATAMAQIMKFWNFPTSGTGFSSYYLSAYGTQSANFGNTTYNWSLMPNNVSSANTAVATLMYQCGVSVAMNYSPDGSSAYVISSDDPVCAQSAYFTYFGYNYSTMQGLRRSNYSDSAWIALLENELNNSRPVQYAGFGSGGGHTWVCDGYDVNNYLHMNWGWSGTDDGYYQLDAMNPGTLGAGGGTGGFNSGEQAIIGIEPGNGGTAATKSIELLSKITVTPNPIVFAQSLKVNADIYNAGLDTFKGAYSVAIFTTAGTFVAFVDSVETGAGALPPGFHYTGGLTFPNGGLLITPGDYTLGIYYKPTGSNWLLLPPDTFTNPINITIEGPVNKLELNSNINVTTLPFVQGKTDTVNVNFINKGSITFYGSYDAALYNLDGSVAQDLGQYQETGGLPTGATYSSPYISIKTAAITAAPGTYILGISELQKDSSTWRLVGGENFTNPINVAVVAAQLLPDIYEPDNTPDSAYNLPVTWTGNTANPNTKGSNINVETDYDYYNINLAAGYNYVITARVDDSYSSTNGTKYTCDVVWSYNSGSGWSPSYDPIMPGNITVSGAGSVMFSVAPYFAGQTGTYLLNINITRTAITGIENVTVTDGMKLYPNPAGSFINLSFGQNNPGDFQVKIFNSIGQLVMTKNINGSLLQSIDVAELPAGIYYLEAADSRQRYVAKFAVGR